MARVQKAESTTPPPVLKPSALPPSGDRDAILKRFKDFPNINVLERRFLDPRDPGSLPIFLKDENPDACVNSDHQNRLKTGATTCSFCKKASRKWFIYWVNTAKEGRWAQIKGKGYVPVEVKDLLDVQDVADLVKQTEESGSIYVRRGDRGQEILCKQPLDAYLYIKRLQREQRDARDRSATLRRQDRAEAAGRELGDEAGQAIYDGDIKEESMRRHKTTLADEAASDGE